MQLIINSFSFQQAKVSKKRTLMGNSDFINANYCATEQYELSYNKHLTALMKSDLPTWGRCHTEIFGRAKAAVKHDIYLI